MILAQLKQVYFAIFNSTLIKSLLPSAGFYNSVAVELPRYENPFVSIFLWIEKRLFSQREF